MIGDKIRLRREELGMTQTELAQRLGYKSRSSINKMEMNCQSVSPRKIKQIASILKTSTSYLLEEGSDDILLTNLFNKIRSLDEESINALNILVDAMLKNKSNQ